MNIASLQEKRISELQSLARDLGITGVANLEKRDLIYRILEAHADTVTVDGLGEGPTSGNGQGHGGDGQSAEPTMAGNPSDGYSRDFDPKKVPLRGIFHKAGILEVLPDGYGFLRSSDYRYHPSADDIYVSPSQIKRFSLKIGDRVEGEIRPPREGQRFFALIHVGAINDRRVDASAERTSFEFLTPTMTSKAFTLETEADLLAPRIIDLFCPIGIGNRVLVIAPPQSGRTTLLLEVAGAISKNHPDIHILALLLNQQPDDIVDLERFSRAEVFAATFGDPPERHAHMAALVGENAKRMVEAGHDVVLVIDSLTELVRAHGSVSEGDATVGFVRDSDPVRASKSLFSSAQAVEEGGSLTIIATLLVGTGNPLDEQLYHEFREAPNTTITLSEELASSRRSPAIDLRLSRTSRDEELFPAERLEAIRRLRKYLRDQEPAEALNDLIERLTSSSSNAEMIASQSQNG